MKKVLSLSLIIIFIFYACKTDSPGNNSMSSDYAAFRKENKDAIARQESYAERLNALNFTELSYSIPPLERLEDGTIQIAGDMTYSIGISKDGTVLNSSMRYGEFFQSFAEKNFLYLLPDLGNGVFDWDSSINFIMKNILYDPYFPFDLTLTEKIESQTVENRCLTLETVEILMKKYFATEDAHADFYRPVEYEPYLGGLYGFVRQSPDYFYSVPPEFVSDYRLYNLTEFKIGLEGEYTYCTFKYDQYYFNFGDTGNKLNENAKRFLSFMLEHDMTFFGNMYGMENFLLGDEMYLPGYDIEISRTVEFRLKNGENNAVITKAF